MLKLIFQQRVVIEAEEIIGVGGGSSVSEGEVLA